MKKSLLAVIAVLAAAPQAMAATQITVSCAPPTTRTDQTALAIGELKSFSFFQEAVAVPPAVLAPNCVKVIPIPKGECIAAGTKFSVVATDTGDRSSDPGVGTLNVQACNEFAKPTAPTVTVTVQ